MARGDEGPLGRARLGQLQAVAFVEPVTSSKRTGASRPAAASARSSSIVESMV